MKFILFTVIQMILPYSTLKVLIFTVSCLLTGTQTPTFDGEGGRHLYMFYVYML